MPEITLDHTEQRIIEDARPGHIDLQAFRSFLRARGVETGGGSNPPSQDDLRTWGALTDVGGLLRPTLYGVLAFGKMPQSYTETMSCWVQCVAYAGTDRASDAILVGEGQGWLDEQVQRALGWSRALGWTERYRGIFREDIPLLPMPVLREVLANAVAHRDYSIRGSRVMLEVFADRVDVTSPGSLPPGVAIGRIQAGGFCRAPNSRIAGYLVARRLMARRGQGWLMMRHAMRRFNGTEPELANDARSRFVRVTFRLEPGLTGSSA